MTDTRPGFFAGTLQILGGFLYKLIAVVAIMWIVGLVVGLFTGDPPASSGGGPSIP